MLERERFRGRLVILSAGESWHVQDLLRAAARAGMDASRMDFRGLAASVGAGALGLPSTLEISPDDAVVVRTMPAGTLEQVIFRMDVLQRLEASGVLVLNSPRALEAAIDKYLSLARIEAAGLPVPPTAVCETLERALSHFEALGGDVVVKPLFGSEGRGVERVSSRREAESKFREIEAAGAVIYLQRFVRHPGHDYRVLTLGGAVLCAMRRLAAGGWITNVARGARPEAMEAGPELASLALAAARAVGAEVAGVDIVPDEEGRPWVLEVNAVPGWRAIGPTTGVDVAAEVLRYVRARTGMAAVDGKPGT